jgi:hypothetical protein
VTADLHAAASQNAKLPIKQTHPMTELNVNELNELNELNERKPNQTACQKCALIIALGKMFR